MQDDIDVVVDIPELCQDRGRFARWTKRKRLPLRSDASIQKANITMGWNSPGKSLLTLYDECWSTIARQLDRDEIAKQMRAKQLPEPDTITRHFWINDRFIAFKGERKNEIRLGAIQDNQGKQDTFAPLILSPDQYEVRLRLRTISYWYDPEKVTADDILNDLEDRGQIPSACCYDVYTTKGRMGRDKTLYEQNILPNCPKMFNDGDRISLLTIRMTAEAQRRVWQFCTMLAIIGFFAGLIAGYFRG